MRNGVTPGVQFLEQMAPLQAPRIERVHRRPKANSETAKIRTKISRVRIASIQFSVLCERCAHSYLECGGTDGSNQTVGSFRVKIATVALKLRGKQYGIRLIDLLCRIATTTCRAAHALMSILQFV